MDNLFLSRVLTASLNNMRTPGRKIFQRHFAGKTHMEPSSRLAFDVISGSEKVLKAIKSTDPAPVGKKTGRKTITLEAPRLAEKRIIHLAEIENMRAYGQQFMVEQLKTRIAREQLDMRNIFDRTLEFWAANVLHGKIYDSDLSTVLVDYNLTAEHKPTLTGTGLWTDANSNPVTQIRAWKQLIADDSGHDITGWHAWCGSAAMDALIGNATVQKFLTYQKGAQIAEQGRIAFLAEVPIEEYNGSYLDASDNRKRFVGAKEFILVAEGPDVFDCPYAPIIQEANGGVGNGANGGQLFFSKSWKEEDPAGRWIFGEARPLPVLKRPDAIVCATVVA